MKASSEGAGTQPPADGPPVPAERAPDGGLDWIVDYGYSSSLAEAESLRARALGASGGGVPPGRGLPGPGTARWRRWLEVGRPDPEPEAVREAVLAWQIEALGNNAGHHLVRDVLHASLSRDRRTEVHHRTTMEPEPWMEDRVAHLGDRHRREAIQHTVLDAMNRRLIGLLWRELEGRVGPPDPDRLVLGDDHGLLLSLWACQPVGVLLAWRGGADHVRDFGDGGCGQARVCPWCHARQVRDIHDRLLRGPCRPERLEGRCLIRIRASFSGGQLRYEPEFAAFSRGRGYDACRAGGPSWTRRFLGRDEVRLVKEHWWSWLSSARKAWGIEGGILTHQVGPYLDRQDPSGVPEHQHEVTLVGSLPADRLADVAQNAEELGIPFTNRRVALAHVDVLRGDDRQALRYLLAGPPYRSSKSGGLLYRNFADLRSPIDESGALRLMPWFLATPEQWWSHHGATKWLDLYSAFGTWRGMLGRTAGDTRRRLAPLKLHNERNRSEALGRRAGLLDVARPIYEELASRSGRRPGHQALRDAMRRASRDLSIRDARWLVQELGTG